MPILATSWQKMASWQEMANIFGLKIGPKNDPISWDDSFYLAGSISRHNTMQNTFLLFKIGHFLPMLAISWQKMASWQEMANIFGVKIGPIHVSISWDDSSYLAGSICNHNTM